jgi:predicted transcriptional regulator
MTEGPEKFETASVSGQTDVEIFRRLCNQDVVALPPSSTAADRRMVKELKSAISAATTEPAAVAEVVATEIVAAASSSSPETGRDRKSEAAATTESQASQVMRQALAQTVASEAEIAAPTPGPRALEAHQEGLHATPSELKDATSQQRSSALVEAVEAARLARQVAPPQSVASERGGVSQVISAPTLPPASVQGAPRAPAPPPIPLSTDDATARHPPTATDNEARQSSASVSGGDTEGERLEKQGFLIELQALESRGAKLSRRFGMQDTLGELEFEVNRQTSLLNTQSTVSFMKDSLRLLVNAVEIANTRFGPVLAMDGWAESIVSDMNRFNSPFEKIYKRYWRKQQVSPIMELGWILLGSLVMTHFKNKIFGPRRDDSFKTEARPPSSAPHVFGAHRTGQGAPQMPMSSPVTPGQPKMSSAASTSTRPVLRPLFGGG